MILVVLFIMMMRCGWEVIVGSGILVSLNKIVRIKIVIGSC